MNKKRGLYILSGIMLIFVVMVAIYVSTFIQPKIVFTAEIKPLSDEDYKRVLNNEQVTYPDKDIEKFKNINIQIKVTTPIGIKHDIKIERDILQQYLKDNERIQVLGGGSFEHGNGKEYGEDIEIYLINLSGEQLKNQFEDFRYKVTWKDFWGKPNDKIFYFKDYLN